MFLSVSRVFTWRRRKKSNLQIANQEEDISGKYWSNKIQSVEMNEMKYSISLFLHTGDENLSKTNENIFINLLISLYGNSNHPVNF